MVASRCAVLAASAGVCLFAARMAAAFDPAASGGMRSRSRRAKRSGAPGVRFLTLPTSSAMPISATDLIRQFDLQPHPEGGYFRETYRATDSVVRPADGAPRAASTAIYYLLCDGAYSSWHRIRSDEVWHFYAGDPIEVWVLDERDGLTIHRLGNPAHASGHRVPGGRAGRELVRRALRGAGARRARRLHGGAGFRVRGIRTGRRSRAGRRVSRLRGTRRAACAAPGRMSTTAVPATS